MKYKFTLKFEVEDHNDSVTQEIQEKGLVHIQEQIALGFSDPEFEKLTCTIEEIKNDNE